MTKWQTYWLLWFGVSFTSFIVPEVWALVTDVRNTLSCTIWDLEQFLPGTSVWKWTAVHVLVGGALAVLLSWLIGHLVFGIWV